MKRWDRTHEALRHAAIALFTEHGYDAAATAQIAERAGVSEMTLYRHFPNKEALLLTDPFDPLMAEAVRARPSDERTMRALAEGVRQAWTTLDAESTRELRQLLQIVVQTPTLQGAIERNSAETIAALTDALGDRGVDRAQAHIAATATIAGLSAALLEWARSDHAALDVVLASALDVLGGK